MEIRPEANLPPPRQPHSGRLARLKVLADAHKQPDGSHGRHMVTLPQGPICLHSPRSPLGSFRDTRTHSHNRQPATAGVCSRGNLLCGRGSCCSFLVEQCCDIVVDERAERFPTKIIGQLFVTPVWLGGKHGVVERSVMTEGFRVAVCVCVFVYVRVCVALGDD